MCSKTMDGGKELPQITDWLLECRAVLATSQLTVPAPALCLLLCCSSDVSSAKTTELVAAERKKRKTKWRDCSGSGWDIDSFRTQIAVRCLVMPGLDNPSRSSPPPPLPLCPQPLWMLHRSPEGCGTIHTGQCNPCTHSEKPPMKLQVIASFPQLP